MSNRLNETELARLVAAQKRRITQVLLERDEARGIAKQLLKELRAHVETPPVYAEWLKDKLPAINEEKAREE
jgi:hypothetical protein